MGKARVKQKGLHNRAVLQAKLDAVPLQASARVTKGGYPLDNSACTTTVKLSKQSFQQEAPLSDIAVRLVGISPTWADGKRSTQDKTTTTKKRRRRRRRYSKATRAGDTERRTAPRTCRCARRRLSRRSRLPTYCTPRRTRPAICRDPGPFHDRSERGVRDGRTGGGTRLE